MIPSFILFFYEEIYRTDNQAIESFIKNILQLVDKQLL